MDIFKYEYVLLSYDLLTVDRVYVAYVPVDYRNRSSVKKFKTKLTNVELFVDSLRLNSSDSIFLDNNELSTASV